MIGNTIEYRIDIADLLSLMRIGLVRLMAISGTPNASEKPDYRPLFRLTDAFRGVKTGFRSVMAGQ